VSDVVAAYHDLLADPDIVAASCGLLQQGQQAHGLCFGEHPLSVSLRPRLIDRPPWDRAVAAAEAIYGALSTLEAALLADADLRAELDLLPEEERLALADPHMTASSPSSRLDSFFADDIGYVEYNAESPAGMAYGDELAKVFDSLPVMQRLRERYSLRSLPVREQQLDATLQSFHEWAGADRPSLAIVDWAGLPTLHEFDLFKRYFESQGIPTCICEPGSLEFSDGALHACNGSVVNIVYRRVLTSELLAKGDDFVPLRKAYLAGEVCVVNSFRAKLLHKKMSLALLSDDRYEALYSAHERAAIARHVPWTRKVREGPSTRHGKPVDDLVAHIVAHRRELVLKPNDEYGGKGVVLGWTVDDHEWEQAVHVALTQSYVVQELIPVPREPFPVAVGERVEMLDLAVDMDPYLFRGSVGGVLTRLSSSALLNVTAGSGSVVPTYIVEGTL
jgi:uncharacterized circularly permuted ATP-grasp superfamily protein